MNFLQINQIGFPGLGINFNINPVAFTVFGKEIYWYGIIIAAAVISAIIYAQRESKRIGLKDDVISDVVLIGVPVSIIFARAYYVIFSWKDYASNPISSLYIWEGGLAIYGGIIGAFLTGFIYCKIKKIKFYTLADIAAPAFLLAQSIGRWGNFVNAEAFGEATLLPWRMQLILNGDLVQVHPAFLYESLWNLAGFFLLFSMRKKKPFNGFLFWSYLLWYGLGRAWIEGLRTDSLYLGNVRISQLVAGICIIVSVFVIIFKWHSGKNEEDAEIFIGSDNSAVLNSSENRELSEDSEFKGSETTQTSAEKELSDKNTEDSGTFSEISDAPDVQNIKDNNEAIEIKADKTSDNSPKDEE